MHRTIQLQNTATVRNSIKGSPLRSFLLIPSVLACFALSPTARAVDPPPDRAARGCVAFHKDGPFVVGGQPLHVVTADLNGDGHLDFVIPNAASGVVVYYGDGMGGFSGPNTFFAGVYPHDVAVGDFNGDGMPDLAVAAGIGGNGSGVEVLLNNSDGTFSEATLYPAEDSPSQIAAADFNGDGKLDLAVTDNLSGNVDILLGTGTGAFGPPAIFPGTAIPAGIVVGDFNGDDKLDLAISNYGSQDLRILQGDGNGNFTTIHTYPLGSNASEVAMGDFNHDGRLDLAVGVFNIYPNNHVAIYLGNGDGSFTPGQQISVEDTAGLVAVDLNRDGYLDLAIATFSFNNVTVVRGDGTGQFGAPLFLALGAFQGLPYDVATGDFNGDGKPDLVLADYFNGTAVVALSRRCSH